MSRNRPLTEEDIMYPAERCKYCSSQIKRGFDWCTQCGQPRRITNYTKLLQDLTEFKIKTGKISSRGRHRIPRKRFQIETEDWRCHIIKKKRTK